MQAQSLNQEDTLEEKMVTHSSILASESPCTEEPKGLHSPWGQEELDTTEHAHTHTHSMGSRKVKHD